MTLSVPALLSKVRPVLVIDSGCRTSMAPVLVIRALTVLVTPETPELRRVPALVNMPVDTVRKAALPPQQSPLLLIRSTSPLLVKLFPTVRVVLLVAPTPTPIVPLLVALPTMVKVTGLVMFSVFFDPTDSDFAVSLVLTETVVLPVVMTASALTFGVPRSQLLLRFQLPLTPV